jgi:hypothetical protein
MANQVKVLLDFLGLFNKVKLTYLNNEGSNINTLTYVILYFII